MRWRLKRGLEILRARLDVAHGGDRRSWSLAMLPLARLESTTAITAGAASIALPGVILMNVLKVACASAAVCLIAIGLAVTGVLPESLVPWSRAEEPVPVGFRPLEEQPAEVEEVARLDPAPAAERVEARPLAATEPAPAEPEPAAVTFDAHVFSTTGPIAGAEMVVVLDDVVREEPVRSGRDGFVSFRADSVGEDGCSATVEFHARGFASRAVRTTGTPGETTHLGRVELAPGGVVSGRIVDDQGRGIEGCTVNVGETGVPKRQLEDQRIHSSAEGVPVTRTDPDGRFRLAGVPAGLVRIWGRKHGLMAGYTPPVEVRVGQESFGVELVLEPLRADNLVRGIVLAPDGTPIPRAELDYRHYSASLHSTESGDRKADAHGRFEFELADDALLTLTASDPEGRWGKATVADVHTGELELELRLVEARVVRIAVQGARSERLTSYGLTITDASGDHVLTNLTQHEHADGSASFPLPTTPFLARVTAPGYALLELGPLDPALVGDSLEAFLEPLPGLRGRVLRDDVPVAGVEVTLHSGVPADRIRRRNGFRVRMRRDAEDTTRTDDEGSFLLTPREPGEYFVRAQTSGRAPAEYGPFTVGSDLAGPEIELHLVEAGAIEGRVVLASGADGEGAVIGLTRGDGWARTQRAGPDGAFRFADLMPGPWQLELREEELNPGRTHTQTVPRGGAPAFEDLEWSCTVYPGETTYFDLHEVPEEHWPIQGRLTLNGESARGWTAALAPTGTFQIDGGPRTDLGADGSFVLEAASAGKHRLILRGMLDERGGQFLVDEIRTGGAPWRLDLDVGELVLEGMESWSDQGMPRLAHYWKGPGELFCITAPTPDAAGVGRMPFAPAGPGKLVTPDATFVPENWPVLREVDVDRGGVTTLRLD